MMKRRFVILVLFFITIIVSVNLMVSHNNNMIIRSFSVSEYSYEIEKFPSMEVIGQISDVEELLDKVEMIWIKIYGNRIRKEKPYQVFYDEINGVWLVRGTLHFYSAGGVSCILVKDETGEVLAVWHEK